jgi:hypothetical protein
MVSRVSSGCELRFLHEVLGSQFCILGMEYRSNKLLPPSLLYFPACEICAHLTSTDSSRGQAVCPLAGQ